MNALDKEQEENQISATVLSESTRHIIERNLAISIIPNLGLNCIYVLIP